jgi:hypothetical protein
MSRRFLLVVVGLCGCGSDNPKLIDSGPPDTPAPPPGCDFGELDDMNNDDITSMSGLPETTNLMFATQTVLCGRIDTTHFDSARTIVDVDSYLFSVPTDSDVLVQLSGTGAEALTDVEVALFAGNRTVNTGTFLGTHAVMNAHLPAGAYELTVFAANMTAPATPVDYKVKILVDQPTTRCGKLATPATYTEANDGAGDAGNDMVEVRYVQNGTMNRVLTAAADAPEPTNIVTTAGTSYRITGTMAPVNAADEYQDRDAYLLRTGNDTNQLTVRLNWPGDKADLDYMLFTETKVPEIADGFLIAPMEEEFQTFSVLPNTNYWLWIGAYDFIDQGQTVPPTLPVVYNASICADNYTP